MARLPKRTARGTMGTPRISQRPTYGFGRKGRPFHNLRKFNIARAIAKKKGRPGPTASPTFRMPKIGTHRKRI